MNSEAVSYIVHTKPTAIKSLYCRTAYSVEKFHILQSKAIIEMLQRVLLWIQSSVKLVCFTQNLSTATGLQGRKKHKLAFLYTMMFKSLELIFMNVVGINQTSLHPVQGQPCILFKDSLDVPEVVFIFSSLLCALPSSLVSGQLSDRDLCDKGRNTKKDWSWKGRHTY